MYLITCDICQQQYVGETKRSFGTRIKEHLADIKHKRDKPLSLHFRQKSHKTTKLTYQIIEIINKDPTSDISTKYRKEKEMYWIHQLRTIQPVGINSKNDY